MAIERQEQEEEKTSSLIGGTILLILSALIILLLVINYFNILPLSRTFPNIFGLFPHRQSITTKQQTTTTTNNNLPPPLSSVNYNNPITINCPVPKEFCSQGKLITYKGKTVGMGFNLPQSTPLYAVFGGTANDGAIGGGKLRIKMHTIRWLQGQQNLSNYVAAYDFFGNIESAFMVNGYSPRVFSQGEKIGTTNNDSYPNIDPFNSVNLIFRIIQGSKYGQLFPFDKIRFRD